MREDSLQILYRLDPNPRKASSKADELKYWIDQLENRMVRQCTPVSGWEMKSCYYHGYENYTDLDNWHPVSLGEHWGGDDVTGFFRASAIMPEVLEDAQVFLNLSFGGEALLSINGVPHQGIDFDRKYANLVLEDETLSEDDQDVVDKAVSDLSAAIENLSVKNDDTSKADDGSNDTSKPDDGKGDSNTSKPDAPATGDNNLYAEAALVMVLSMTAIGLLIWKRKRAVK